MKKLSFVFFIIGFYFAITSTNAQTHASQVRNFSKKTTSPIDGAWRSVDKKTFFMMNEGFFAYFSLDSVGVSGETHAGTYADNNNNTITYKTLYCSEPSDIGSLMTVEYHMKGELLELHFFKKLIDPKGVDMTAQAPKGIQKQFVRAKN